MPIDRRLAQAIRRCRTAHGLTQARLGQMAHVKRDQIGEYERGITRPRLATLMRLAAALETTIATLLDGDGAGISTTTSPPVVAATLVEASERRLQA